MSTEKSEATTSSGPGAPAGSPGSRLHRHERLLAWLVLVTLLLLTLSLTRYVWRTTRIADRSRYDYVAQTTRDAIEERLVTYNNILIATASVFGIDRTTTRTELRQYIEHLNVPRRYPGIQGIGLSVRIPPEEVPRVVDEMRAEFPGFRVWPDGKRDEYHAIVLLEPLDRRNTAAIGYDMFTDPVRRAAMLRARDTSRPSASGPVTLIQELAEKRPGFLIYVPVYVTGTPPAEIDARRNALLGFVYAPFRIDDFFHGILGSHPRPEIGFQFYDGDQLMYATGPMPKDSRFTSTDDVTIAGRNWTIRFFSNRTGSGGAARLALATLVVGVIISVLLFMLIRVQSRARATAERANRAKDEFLATLSHELRTPMTSIMGWSRLLAEGLDEETATTAIDAIQKSGRAQAQLIDDLLDVSRITARKMRIDARPIDLRPIVTAAVDMVAATAIAKDVEVDVRLPAGAVVVNGDAQRLQQVIWNLLSNAVKFTPNGGRVIVSLAVREQNAIIEVCDTGIGIEPEFIPFVFERFRQADSSSTRAHTGLGLGLAIVQHLIALHGGVVEADSEGIGKGATFRVRLPLISAHAKERRAR
ncbi:MAG TPA: CHASE domain-containing protein, partial [Thermoanaerobaculia bacterium]|nr:CHASE domain-containing protein [Thermoanaerobaculia bacterium]